ncbi:DUF2188 domain-containing protein [Gracilimonas halophila]|uniref:DUF2188 domain-containing protein n=1 Tax=Gracilimonas halophila TaxID=1834464 RepID=A0ABW5JGM5_9BACT
MSKPQDRTVYKRDDGKWVNKRNDASKGSIHNTQSDAAAQARKNLKNQGGGELIIKGLNGKIRDKDTISPGNEPRSIKG